MGEIQLDIYKSILERYGFLIHYDEGRITYLETILDKVEGVGHFEPLRHYAEVHILLEPLERGKGLVFENQCQRNTLPLNFQNLVLTHMQEIQHLGVLTGSPITDMKLTLVTGKSHLKHTEGGDFREATYRAIRQGLKKTKSLLLEPYYEFEMIVENHISSKIIYDLDTFHSDYQISYEQDLTIIKGKAPVRYLMTYQKDLRINYLPQTPLYNEMDTIMETVYKQIDSKDIHDFEIKAQLGKFGIYDENQKNQRTFRRTT